MAPSGGTAFFGRFVGCTALEAAKAGRSEGVKEGVILRKSRTINGARPLGFTLRQFADQDCGDAAKVGRLRGSNELECAGSAGFGVSAATFWLWISRRVFRTLGQGSWTPTPQSTDAGSDRLDA